MGIKENRRRAVHIKDVNVFIGDCHAFKTCIPDLSQTKKANLGTSSHPMMKNIFRY